MTNNELYKINEMAKEFSDMSRTSGLCRITGIGDVLMLKWEFTDTFKKYEVEPYDDDDNYFNFEFSTVFNGTKYFCYARENKVGGF